MEPHTSPHEGFNGHPAAPPDLQHWPQPQPYRTREPGLQRVNETFRASHFSVIPPSMPQHPAAAGPSEQGHRSKQPQFPPSQSSFASRYSQAFAPPHHIQPSLRSPPQNPEAGPSSGAVPYIGPLSPFPVPLGQKTIGGTAAQPWLANEEHEEDERAAVPLGHVRCYWAILSTAASTPTRCELTFLYCDPVLQNHLGPESDALIGRSFFEFVRPSEKERARSDLSEIIASRTLFGSVTRCLYFRLPVIREALGCAQAPRDPDAKSYVADELYIPLDFVLNSIGESTALCFFHAVINRTAQDNNEQDKSHWTNWCGTDRDLMDEWQCNRVWSSLLRRTPLPPRTPTPSYVFQILTMSPEDQVPEILLSWPPPRFVPSGRHTSTVSLSSYSYQDGSYFADEFAQLAQSVRLSNAARNKKGYTTLNGEPGTIQDGACTSCTRRFRAKHILTTEGMVRSIESVVVPYGTIMLASFYTTYTQTVVRTPGSISSYSGGSRSESGTPPELYSKRNKGDVPHQDNGEVWAVPDSFYTQRGDYFWPPAVTRSAGVTVVGTEGPSATRGSAAPLFEEAHAVNYSAMSKRKAENYSRAPESLSPPVSQVSSIGSPPAVTSSVDGESSTAYPSGVVGKSLPAGSASYSHRSSESDGPSATMQPPTTIPLQTPASTAAPAKHCSSCGTANSPEWRKGPTGQKTLCNACGLRYSRSISRQQKKNEKAAAAAATAAGEASTPAMARTEQEVESEESLSLVTDALKVKDPTSPGTVGQPTSGTATPRTGSGKSIEALTLSSGLADPTTKGSDVSPQPVGVVVAQVP